MTVKNWEVGDKVGRFTIEDFAGTNVKTKKAVWYVKDESGNLLRKSDRALRSELAKADWTPAKIRGLSSKAYTELRDELGEETINEIMGATPKRDLPDRVAQIEISNKWFEAHPQIPVTSRNAQLFNKYLAEIPNPSGTSRDLDLAFSELFTQVELNPLAAGIQGHGEAIRGEAALQKLTASQVQQLQKSFPVGTKPKNHDRSQVDEAIVEIGDASPTADAFIANLKALDKSLEEPEQVPPLMMEARRQLWASFFQLHPGLQPSPELQQALITVCEDNRMPMLLQSLDLALEILVEKDSPVIQRQESGVKSYNGGRWVDGTPRPKSPLPAFDDAPVTVTLDEINRMPSGEYAKKVLNPRFREAVDSVLQKVGQAR